jgi:tryptophan-rich sensory protein
LWSFFFFGLQNPLAGFIEIILLWVAIAVTIFEFYRLSKKAGLILLPYIIWVSIAAVLNYYILVLNA